MRNLTPRPVFPVAITVATAIVVSITVLADSAHAQSESASVQAESQTRFSRGRDLFRSGSFEQALEEFRAANELVHSPNTRLYIARTLQQIGRFAEAYTEF